jgi:hypothetical protein
MIQAVLGERYRLGERIAATWRLPFAEAFALGEQVARALAAAHAHGLVHRALAKHPADRFPSATALADALSSAAAPDHRPQHARAAQDTRAAAGAREPRPPLSAPRRGGVAQPRAGCRSLSTGPGGPAGRWWRWGRSS